jgi:hypothetical protein
MVDMRQCDAEAAREPRPGVPGGDLAPGAGPRGARQRGAPPVPPGGPRGPGHRCPAEPPQPGPEVAEGQGPAANDQAVPEKASRVSPPPGVRPAVAGGFRPQQTRGGSAAVDRESFTREPSCWSAAAATRSRRTGEGGRLGISSERGYLEGGITRVGNPWVNRCRAEGHRVLPTFGEVSDTPFGHSAP